jgi:hypothetical protein
MSSINLVSPKNAQLEKDQNRLKMARLMAFAVMLIVAAVAILVFVVNLTLPLNSIKNEEATTLSNIAALHKKLVQYYLIEDRVNNLANVISQRKNLPSTVDLLLATISQDLAVSSMQVDAKKVSFIVSGGSLIAMNKFIDDLILLDTQKKIIKNIVMQDLSLDVKNGNYSVSIQADVK